MQEIIVNIRVKDNGIVCAFIRKAIFTDERKVIRKEALTKDGGWVIVPEGMPYPDECLLPVAGACNILGVNDAIPK